MYGKPGGVAGAVILPATGAAFHLMWLPFALAAIIGGLLLIRYGMLRHASAPKDPRC